MTVLTDKLLFASGQDTLKPASYPLLNEIATLIDLDNAKHPVVVEGYTDDVPIQTAEFPSNWELSTGRADQRPAVPAEPRRARRATERRGLRRPATRSPRTRRPPGRAKNRRVEIVFERKYPAPNPGA